MRRVVLPLVAVGIWSACDRAGSLASSEAPYHSGAVRTLDQTRPFVARLSGSKKHVACHPSEPSAEPTDLRCQHAYDASTLSATARLVSKVGAGPMSGRDTDRLWALAI